MQIEIELMEGGVMPAKEFEYSAGYDLTAPCDFHVQRGRSVMPLGFKIKLPVGYVGKICSRSGVAAKGVPGFLSKMEDELVNVKVNTRIQMTPEEFEALDANPDYFVTMKTDARNIEGLRTGNLLVDYREKDRNAIRMDRCSIEMGHVDCGNRGEVGIIIDNRDCEFWIKKGTSIAQMIIEQLPSVELKPVASMSDTCEDGRGTQGFNA